MSASVTSSTLGTVAVFCEDEVTWDKEAKVHRCRIKIHNYTARPRAYSILAQYPETDTATFVENELGGRREVKGIWCWKLDTIPPGEAGNIEFSIQGLEHNDWNATEVFFRGSGDIIGASKIDEGILEQIRTEEEIATKKALEESNMALDDAMGHDADNSGDLDAEELQKAMMGPIGERLEHSDAEEAIAQHDIDDSGTLDREELLDATQSDTSRQSGLGEWGDE